MTQLLEQCASNLKDVGSNPTHICVCKNCFIRGGAPLSYVSRVASVETKPFDSTEEPVAALAVNNPRSWTQMYRKPSV